MSPLRNSFTAVAGADLSAAAGHCLRYVSDTGNQMTVNLMTDATIAGAQVFVGVLETGVANGAICTIVRSGIIDNAVAGGVITAGTHFELSCDANGHFVAASDGDRVFGHFIGHRDASDGDLISVDIQSGYQLNVATTDIVGDVGAVDNALVKSDGVGGQTIQDTDFICSDAEVITCNNATSGITFGAAAQDGSAVIESVSTTRGWLPSRMTTAQQAAINGAACTEGTFVYDTDRDSLVLEDNAGPRALAKCPATSTDHAFARWDGAGGATLQDTANATLSDAGQATFAAGVICTAGGLTVTAGGATITAGDLTVTAGNVVLSNAGATVDGVDLDTAIRGALGGTDESFVRSDGVGGVDAQGTGANATCTDAGAATFAAGVTCTAGGLTVTAGGATITAGDLTLTAGNIVLSNAGATVDGRDLDDMVETAGMGATDNSIVRTDGAGGLTTQGTGANATITDAGAPTFAGILTVTAGGADITGNIVCSGTVDGQDLAATLGAMRCVTLTPQAEAANTIAVDINVVDLTGAAVNAVTRIVCTAHTPNAANDCTLTETGAGALVAVGAAHEMVTIIVDTDANGDAQVSVNNAVVGAVCFTCEIMAASGATYWGFGRSTDLNFT